MIPIQKSATVIKANHRKVVARLLNIKSERLNRIYNSILDMEEDEARQILTTVQREFNKRHTNFEGVLIKHFEIIAQGLETVLLSNAKKLLLGAYFTHEYAVEGAALFNPSIVPHPDQSNLGAGRLRFIMSMRAVGESHISSIGFRTGVVDLQGTVHINPDSDMWTCGSVNGQTVTESGYDVSFEPSTPLEGRVIFPFSKQEINGMEDVRFVRFYDGQSQNYFATYTAYDGKKIKSQVIETQDFLNFQVRSLRGKAILGKGMALFPEKIDNSYVMIGRQGGQCISIMWSSDLYRWDNHTIIQYPAKDWELYQVGNCGSPIKTDEGWLLLTHCVGPMRKYVLSATLLDLHDPARVIGTLSKPLLSAEDGEREGYVPNVVYTCGWIQHLENIIIPYAMSDRYIGFATLRTSDLLKKLAVSNPSRL